MTTPPPPTPTSAQASPSEPSSVWGSFRRRGRGQGLSTLLCAASSHFRSPLLPVTFHPFLGCPSKAAPVVNNWLGAPHKAGAWKPLSREQWPGRPIMRRPQCLTPYVALAKGRGGARVPAPPGAELFLRTHGGSYSPGGTRHLYPAISHVVFAIANWVDVSSDIPAYITTALVYFVPVS